MNVVHSCYVCRQSFEAEDAVVKVSREVRKQYTGSLDPGTESEDRYVHPDHEAAAAAAGFRRLKTGTLIELERERNPNLFK